ncbi:hypothetical protein F4778DRAFT_792456 [Xylariomycetidae sp. FL2044]|nr:hypothetical protein F4778DRAFT_792456 [Xylariomycetidae sp. FL2044]
MSSLLSVLLGFIVGMINLQAIALFSFCTWFTCTLLPPYLDEKGIDLPTWRRDAPRVIDMKGASIACLVGAVGMAWLDFFVLIGVILDQDILWHCVTIAVRSRLWWVWGFGFYGTAMYLSWAFWTLTEVLDEQPGKELAGRAWAATVWLITSLTLAAFVRVLVVIAGGIIGCIWAREASRENNRDLRPQQAQEQAIELGLRGGEVQDQPGQDLN